MQHIFHFLEFWPEKLPIANFIFHTGILIFKSEKKMTFGWSAKHTKSEEK